MFSNFTTSVDSLKVGLDLVKLIIFQSDNNDIFKDFEKSLCLESIEEL